LGEINVSDITTIKALKGCAGTDPDSDAREIASEASTKIRNK